MYTNFAPLKLWGAGILEMSDGSLHVRLLLNHRALLDNRSLLNRDLPNKHPVPFQFTVRQCSSPFE